jgi:subtilisin family serine protease
MGTRLARVAALTCVVTAALAGAAAALVPSDPQGAHPAYAALNLPAAWDLTTGSPDVVIAIADSGVDPTHPDLAGAVRPGYDFVDDDADAADSARNGHGTAVAGAAAARANNGLGGVGTCFGCSVMPLRVLGPDGIALNVDTAAAIDHAVDHGAAVVNASIYGSNSPSVLRDAIARARAAGVLVVAAAGNDASDAPRYPAAFPDAIAVASASATGERASFTNYGEWVDFAAPDCAPITTLGGGTGVGCATSVSTPLVAGVVGLLRARAPFATADDLERALAATAHPVAGTQHGLVDAAAALERLGQPPPTLHPVVLGEPVVGEELEGFSSLWSGAGVVVAYRWERCRNTCASIPGATGARYEPTTEDAGATIRLALSSPGLADAVSPATATVGARPALTGRPSIAGRARVGARLVARVGSWEGTNLRYAVVWQRCRGGCSPAGTGPIRRVRARDRGWRLRVEVTASNGLGSVTAFSRLTARVR